VLLGLLGHFPPNQSTCTYTWQVMFTVPPTEIEASIQLPPKSGGRCDTVGDYSYGRTSNNNPPIISLRFSSWNEMELRRMSPNSKISCGVATDRVLSILCVSCGGLWVSRKGRQSETGAKSLLQAVCRSVAHAATR
jgi:hypothetical protein